MKTQVTNRHKVPVRILVLLLLTPALFMSCRADTNKQLQGQLETLYAQLRAAALDGNKEKVKSLEETGADEDEGSPEQLKAMGASLPADLKNYTTVSFEFKIVERS